MSLLSYVRAVPKTELHVHLEGTIRPATLLQLAKRHRVELPASTVDGLQEWFDFRNFSQFVDVFVTCSRCMQWAEDYEFVVYEYGAELHQQNVRYAEITFSASEHYARGISHDTYFSGLQRGRERVWEDFGVQIAWIFNIVRKWSDPTRLRAMAHYVTSAAIDGKDDGVVALGLAGPEAGAPPEDFVPWFDRARGAGLHSAPHAGEMVGPKSIWGALKWLGAERIGHGVRAIEDPDLVRHLAYSGTPLEICPHSNVSLGVYPLLEVHPLPILYAAGVTVTVNSDDPPLFDTSLTKEYEALVDPFGMDSNAIDQIALDGVRAAFLPIERKRILEAEFRHEMEALKTAHMVW